PVPHVRPLLGQPNPNFAVIAGKARRDWEGLGAVAWRKQHFHSAVVALGRGALVLCVFALVGTPARGSDPQSYTVAIAETGDKALDTALSDASQLQALKDKAPVGPFALITRAKNDYDRVQTV